MKNLSDSLKLRFEHAIIYLFVAIFFIVTFTATFILSFFVSIGFLYLSLFSIIAFLVCIASSIYSFIDTINYAIGNTEEAEEATTTEEEN